VNASRRQVKRRNHTVNKGYLKRFANGDSSLTQVALPGDERATVSIDDATVRRNFYVVKLADGSEDDFAEDAFSLIETAAAEAFRVLVDQRDWPIPPEARGDIASWVALQYLRVPAVRTLAREMVEEFTGAGAVIRNKDGKPIVLKMPDEAMDDLGGPEPQLELIHRNLANVTKMLCRRGWTLQFYERKTLATSDTPVVLLRPEGYPEHAGVGVENAGGVYVPLDRRAALVMGAEGDPDGRQHGSAKMAALLNLLTAGNARRFIFHHPDDDPLRGLELPEPRAKELVTAGGTGALIQHLFE
jgi:hypothetical protein